MRGFRALADRYTADVERDADAMLSDGEQPRTRAEERLTLPASMQQPTEVHRAIMRGVDQVLTMGLDHGNVGAAPVQLRTAVRMLRRMEKLMLEELAKIPEAECIKMVRALSRALDQLADSVDPEHADHTAPALTDQSASA